MKTDRTDECNQCGLSFLSRTRSRSEAALTERWPGEAPANIVIIIVVVIMIVIIVIMIVIVIIIVIVIVIVIIIIMIVIVIGTRDAAPAAVPEHRVRRRLRAAVAAQASLHFE